MGPRLGHPSGCRVLTPPTQPRPPGPAPSPSPRGTPVPSLWVPVTGQGQGRSEPHLHADEGENRVLISETDYQLYITFYLLNIRNGTRTQVLALYGTARGLPTAWGPGGAPLDPPSREGSFPNPHSRPDPISGAGRPGRQPHPAASPWPRPLRRSHRDSEGAPPCRSVLRTDTGPVPELPEPV